MLLSCILFQVDQSKACQANQNAHHFIPGDGFVIKPIPNENQDDGENGGLHDLRPIQLLEFCQKAAGPSQNKVKNERGYGSNAVGNGLCCEGVHSLGHGLGSNLIDNVAGND
ncbi:hypothetical protein [Fibrobacter sp. UWH1]|uniref:hypothetical protein n=1 Tax=Fibrobacter sp. UWH1 TaxID=1964354 RepID=UPI001595AF5F|nr:hypothetical protein [Fibrobacter sp. UWH1]